VNPLGEDPPGNPPLHGVRVLDLTWGIPGAVATMMLADYGAEVVHVDRPDGDPAGSATGTRTWDRGKRRVALDLDDPAPRAAFMALAADADVVLVGLDEEDARRLGVDAASITAMNPDVVYAALTGFGLVDGRRTPGFDALVAAELGAMVTAPAQQRDGPVFLGHPAIAYSTAFVTTIGVLAALRARIVSGQGDVLDVSLLDGVLAQFTMNWWTASDVSFLSKRTADGQLDLGHTRMLVRQYRCADGQLIQVHSGAPGAFGRLMKVLGLADEISPATTAVESATPLTHADLAVLRRVPEIFATRSSHEWLDDIWSNEIAGLPVLPPTAVFDDPQVVHGGLVRTVVDPELGEIEVVAPPIKLSRTPAQFTDNAEARERPDRIGWTAAGLPARAGERLAGGPLEGVRIVELSTFFAAPYADRFLRDLGASVIKVESTSGDPMRPLPDPFEGACRGKRSIALDLKDPAGRGVIEALIRQADVIQHNFRAGVAERLGLDAESVGAMNADIIYDYAPGYGSTGPKSRLQSFAPLHSGFVGVYWEAAGDGNTPTQTFGNEDYYNGQLNAIGVLLALVHKARSGEGQVVECAQLSSSVFVTSHWYRVGGTPRCVVPRLQSDQHGWSPDQRIYQCLDGYVCVFCVDEAQRAALRHVVIGPDASVHAGSDELTYHFFGETAATWAGRLLDAGVPCAVVREGSWLREFLRDPAALAAGRATEFVHPDHGTASTIARIVQLQSAPVLEPVQAPRVGQHSREILAELGFDDLEVDALIDQAVVRADRTSDAPVEVDR
jgi:crotonobetainyl-CoA:carnitine CoA-transferase CaiB-like acyl-CoA transferase